MTSRVITKTAIKFVHFHLLLLLQLLQYFMVIIIIIMIIVRNAVQFFIWSDVIARMITGLIYKVYRRNSRSVVMLFV